MAIVTSPSITTPPSAETTARSEIKAVYTSIISAHNARQFSRSQPPWSLMASDMKWESAYGVSRWVNLEGHLAQAKAFFESDENMRAELLDLDVDVDLKRGYATCYANQILKSNDVTRHTVTIMEMRLMERTWTPVSVRQIKGMPGLGG